MESAELRAEDLEVWPHLDERERAIVQRGFERGAKYRRDHGVETTARS